MRILNYLPALLTAFVWGSTFVASKLVLDHNVSPLTLMTIRFALAYLILALFGFRHKIQFAWNQQEALLLLAGLTGGSIYFLSEYLALQRTSAINVGLISATVPVIATAITLLSKRILPKWTYIVGSLLALFGVTYLVTDGKFAVEIFPLGDILAIVAATLWALYSVIISRLDKNLPYIAVSRRMMLYSLVSIIPFTIAVGSTDELTAFENTEILLPALYLGCIASALCVFLWNWSIGHVGLIRTNNFLYLLPVVSLLTSALFADELITSKTIIATFLIVAGIIIADR